MRRRPTVIHHEGTPLQPVQDPGRRRVLKLMAASAALAGAGCSQPPPEKIVPYVDMPEGLVPGDPVFYATTLVRGGLGFGVLVETESGRPIKVEGNPEHPASLGAADVHAQAAILTLWDPERSRTVMQGMQPSTWDAMLGALRARLGTEARAAGRGLRLLSGPVGSPTLLSQIDAFLARFPEARWHVHDPAGSDAEAAAAQEVFGQPVRTLYRLDRARLVVSLDADLFGTLADGVRNARDFMVARRATPRARLLAFESSPGLCGAQADLRRALAPADMEQLIEIIAAQLAGDEAQEAAFADTAAPAGQASDALRRRGARLARQLSKARGAAVLAVGPSLSLRAHWLAWRINALLGNVGATVWALPDPGKSPGGLASLWQAMQDGRVDTLLMLDANPVYDAPGSLAFADALARVPFRLHMGLYHDETAALCDWHVPLAHELEAWSDARGPDGTASIVQPVIAPLHGGRSAHELMSVLARDVQDNPHRMVRQYWRARWQGPDAARFEARWSDALRRGSIVDTSSSRPLWPEPTAFAPGAAPAQAAGPPTQVPGDTVAAVFANDSNLVAGAWANNAWLQELPRPWTKITWDNAALISPATAKTHGLRSGDVVALEAADGSGRRVLAPLWLLPGQADGVLTLPLGYGRTRAGRTAQGHGFDAFALQSVEAGRVSRVGRVGMCATGRHHAFAVTQHDTSRHGRELLQAHEAQRARPAPSLYPGREYPVHAWGMSIDLDACIGCNACVVACQAENNIPVVGPEQVALGREMHWLRVDLYREEDGSGAQFQPMACQHCENAPCELVCPVGATMHDSEGLNVQVYNRCVGTRFCSNNCPYKVRHFNFFQYASNDPSAAAHANPDVSVRQRGVMEKCTYCVQRISHARIQAQKEGRAIRDGEVVTACQATCPTEAIVFGDTNDPDSLVSRRKRESRNFTVLGELNTLPRTSYLARRQSAESEPEDDDG